MDIEIRHVHDCPTWRDTEHLVRAIVADLGLDADIRPRLVETVEDADRLGFIGSPTVVIDGVDPFAVRGAPTGLSCRIYPTGTGYAGAPSEARLRDALGAAS